MKKLIVLIVCLTMAAWVSAVAAQPKDAEKKPVEKSDQAPAPAAPAPAAPAPVAPAPAPEKLEKFTGSVQKLDEATKAVVVKDKKDEKTFVINEQTKITKGKASLTAADLKKGMDVTISYKKDGDKIVAADIKVAVPKAPKKTEKK